MLRPHIWRFRSRYAHLYPRRWKTFTLSPEDAVLKEYDRRVTQGLLREDPRQRDAVLKLNDLGNRLKNFTPPPPPETQPTGGLVSWFKRTLKKEAPTPEVVAAPVGLYMFGGVGTGKTMLMDLFLDALGARKQRNRVHFNQFMHDVHMKIHAWRSQPNSHGKGQNKAIEVLVADIVDSSYLLCFDEFQVTNIADAMLLGRLFTALWNKGVVVIATSNRVPDELYKGGLQRDLFIPFIETLKKHCHVHNLDSHKDYRLTGHIIDKIYITGGVDERKAVLTDIWNKLTEDRPGQPFDLVVLGRKIHVREQVKGIARFNFKELCEVPLGAADYAAIGSKFHTLLLDNIPKFGVNSINEVRRFITLIDELYEHKVKLICSAEDIPSNLFEFPTHKPNEKRDPNAVYVGEEEVFAFARTASRLTEMQTQQYLEQPHVKRVPEGYPPRAE